MFLYLSDSCSYQQIILFALYIKVLSFNLSGQERYLVMLILKWVGIKHFHITWKFVRQPGKKEQDDQAYIWKSCIISRSLLESRNKSQFQLKNLSSNLISNSYISEKTAFQCFHIFGKTMQVVALMNKGYLPHELQFEMGTGVFIFVEECKFHFQFDAEFIWPLYSDRI